MKYILTLASLFYISCSNIGNPDKTMRKFTSLELNESNVTLNTNGNFTIFTTFVDNGTEYFANLNKNKILISSLSSRKLIDTINVLFDNKQTEKYGSISSFCFNGKDSLYLLLSRAILFIKNKKLTKTIFINELDTVQYNKMRFANLEDAPIYYDKKTNELIGQIYCSKCKQVDSAFYKSNILGHISLETGKLKTYNITFSEKYISDYYGFANHVYIQSRDSFSIVSFPCEEKMFELNRFTNNITSIYEKSIYQTAKASALDRSLSDSREEKMRHLTTVPYYSQILYDPYRELYYRFFLKNITLKNKDGKYNTFKDKGIVLMVINKEFVVLNEYELNNNLNPYFSFVTKEGLFIKEKTFDTNDSTVFKIIKIKN